MSTKIRVLISCSCLLLCCFNMALADEETARSSSWSALVHEENSLLASILYLPYLFGQAPVRMMDAILLHPKPASRSTIPPPAHQDLQQ